MTDEIEKDIEDLMEPEDLSGIDLGISDEQTLRIYARERFNLAVGYQTLKIRSVQLKASISANEAIGDAKAQKQFENGLQQTVTDMNHLLRGIKEIDKACPEAKGKMKDMQPGT